MKLTEEIRAFYIDNQDDFTEQIMNFCNLSEGRYIFNAEFELVFCGIENEKNVNDDIFPIYIFQAKILEKASHTPTYVIDRDTSDLKFYDYHYRMIEPQFYFNHKGKLMKRYI